MYSTKPLTPPECAKFSVLPSRWSISSIFTPFVEEGQFADALGQDVEMEHDLAYAEDFLIGEEVHFGAGGLRCRDNLHGRDFDAVLDFDGRSSTLPWLNVIAYFLPSRRTISFNHFDRPLTQDTPTPCRPPTPCSCSG